jgi:hypothetical protein
LPEGWEALLAEYRRAGAQVLALYFDPLASRDARDSLTRAASGLNFLEQGSGNWARVDGRCWYWILDLRQTGT